MEVEASFSSIKITNCPILCKECKKIYTNKDTGLKIICECSCHKDKK